MGYRVIVAHLFGEDGVDRAVCSKLEVIRHFLHDGWLHWDWGWHWRWRVLRLLDWHWDRDWDWLLDWRVLRLLDWRILAFFFAEQLVDCRLEHVVNLGQDVLGDLLQILDFLLFCLHLLRQHLDGCLSEIVVGVFELELLLVHVVALVKVGVVLG
jgi:hypothetical protein